MADTCKDCTKFRTLDCPKCEYRDSKLNHVACMPDDTVCEQFKEKKKSKSSGKSKSQADQLIKLCLSKNPELFHDQHSTPYARIKQNNINVTFPIKSRSFKGWLAKLLWDKSGKAPNSEAVYSALNVLQAKALHDATPIGSILVSKLDGSARGGGALSAVAAIGAPIKFISSGEKLGDIEQFVPSRFVGRLLGMGDLQSLVDKVRDAEVKVPEKKVRAFMSGKFTLTDMYEQFESMKKMGPLKGLLKMIPGMSYNIPDDKMNMAEDALKRWRVIIQSMTPKEREKPKILSSSRIRRVARGSGTTEKEVKELLTQYNNMKKMMKTFRRKRMPFFGKGLPTG